MELLKRRKCPKCGGSGALKQSGGAQITHYCECEKCGLRTRDYRSAKSAIFSWEHDREEYFFFTGTNKRSLA